MAVVADGSFENYPNSLRFHLKKKRKIDRLCEIFQTLDEPLQFSKVSKTGSYKTKGISKILRKRIHTLTPNKKIPIWFLQLNSEQRKIVINEISFWDGSKVDNYKSFQYTSTSKPCVDIIQELLLLEGVFSNLNSYPKSESYILTFNLNNRNLDKEIKYESVEVDDYPVGCLVTDTHNFIIRTEDGHTELTGNSCRIADLYARSSSLCGANAYSDHTLQLSSRASQNIHFVGDNSINSMKIDLQEYSSYTGYDIDKYLEAYNAKSASKSKQEKYVVVNVL